MGFPCRSDGSCPFLYQCTSSMICQHLPVFPLTTYPIIIYCLFPLCSAMCNMSGNSFGQYKVILLMDLLNYQANQATILTYPLITGTAIFNAFNLIFKRHPTKATSLIDYNIVMILLPNNLFGSAIGGLVNKFIPPIASDSICLVLMIAFSYKFFMRYRGFKKQQKDESQLFEELQKKQKQRKSYQTQRLQSVQQKQLGIVDQQETQKKSLILSNTQQSKQKKQLRKLIQYESGLHLQHILAIFIIFLVFQTLSFLAQGKIISFSICTEYYPIGMSVLTLVFFAFDALMYRYTSLKMRHFQQIGYHYQYELDKKKNYLLVCLGGFIGGFNGGVFGIGASTTMIFTLLYLKAEPTVISATVGFQVMFIGLGSLCQAMATNQIELSVAGFFLLQTLIIGGILTYFARKLLNRYSQIKINQCLMLIVFSLVTGSSIALIVSIVIGYLQFGATNMDSIAFQC